MTRRFIAGERQDEAIRVVSTLNTRGLTTTIDALGERPANIRFFMRSFFKK
jgi:hypothetical protein